MGRRRWVLAVVAGVAAVAAGVVGWLLLRPAADGEPVATPAPTQTPTPLPVEPLTGLPVTDPDVLERPAVAVKVSDVRSAHPQVGVDRADIVFSEPIGVGTTRLAAVFHSDIPGLAGPVRSVRPMDVPILSPITPVFAHTMGAQWVMTYLESTATVESLGSLQVPSGSGAYRVDPNRPAPDHVLADLPVLLELSQTAQPPQPYFAYAPTAAEASAFGGEPAASITIPYGPGWDVGWTYDVEDGRYQRSQPWGAHVMEDGTPVSATNVLVLQAESVVEKLAPGSGAPVPVVQLIDASGPLIAFTGGTAVQGTWSKAGVEDPFVLTTLDGEPLLLTPGNTWVELPSLDATVDVA